nr:predicted GPI-anchored protein 58 [Oncorhynchus nerka]
MRPGHATRPPPTRRTPAHENGPRNATRPPPQRRDPRARGAGGMGGAAPRRATDEPPAPSGARRHDDAQHAQATPATPAAPARTAPVTRRPDEPTAATPSDDRTRAAPVCYEHALATRRTYYTVLACHASDDTPHGCRATLRNAPPQLLPYYTSTRSTPRDGHATPIFFIPNHPCRHCFSDEILYVS